MNKLANEKSPYLLEHANNPVEWYPWGDEAFTKAENENKPIFLSIGYSTCHWCHVMEHESFEDPEVANLMNKTFVSIKVDREERPDIDNVYMTVCQMMTGSGGWPLTIIMTPDKKPFFAGTYFPKESVMGRIGMLDLIPKVKEIWNSDKDKILESADEITNAIKREISNIPGEELSAQTLNLAFNQLSLRFDKTNGGFGRAPKFPTPHNLLFLLRYWHRTKNQQALDMVEKTLSSMRDGGVYDHIGYGFHRYSTDTEWIVPHFEKMLYDQAMLAMAYTEAYQATGNEDYTKTAKEIFEYVLRDMVSPEGGFYSAEDADSEGMEGKFYLWTEQEIRDILTEEQSELILKVFNVTKNGNYLEEASGQKTGTNILHRTESLSAIAPELGLSPDELESKIESARQELFGYRENRIHPNKDDKILTDWNGLIIAALSKGAQTLEETRYKEAAERAVSFIYKNLIDENGRLLHRYRDGESALQAHVDDYAFLIWGLLELYEATFKVEYLQKAIDLDDILMEYYWDKENGGFFFTADDGEKLLIRQKEIYDGAIPSGNSVAMLNMLKLESITGNSEYAKKASEIGKVFSSTINQSPSAYTQLMSALEFAKGKNYEIVISGKSPESEDSKEILDIIRSTYIPNKVVLFKSDDDTEITKIAEFTKHQESIDNKATVYICQNHVCNKPTTDIDEVEEFLNLE